MAGGEAEHRYGDPLSSRAAVGGGGFGGIGSPRHLIGLGLDETASGTVLDRCVELGVTIVDTAYGYAGGDSHRHIGHWLAGDRDRRRRVAIVDKVGMVARGQELVLDLSPDGVARQAAEGRARMGVDGVDVLMTHGPDPATPIRQTIAALATEIDQGHARTWGISNVEPETLPGWIEQAERLGAPPPMFVENEYSLLARDDEAAILPLCAAKGIGYLAFSPLAGGVLSGRYQRGAAPPAGSRLALRPDAAAVLTDDLHDRLTALAERAADLGVSSAALSLAWVLAQPNIRPIVGLRTPAHLDAVTDALRLQLTPAQADDLARTVHA
ncbi:MAG TPA: aldo/keto reductase [Mycobacteriales bacterium]|nr:aldo/keto reductase [Mycobacteriales bacterium]